MKDLTVTRPFSEEDYNELLQQAVAVIETSRLRIAKQLNTIAMSSYWEIGKLLDERKVDSKHGDSIVKGLSIDLKTKYPDMGLSPRNLWNMKRFYLRYCQYDTKVQQAVAVLPWSLWSLLRRRCANLLNGPIGNKVAYLECEGRN